jgi:hypothetical protein
VAAQHSWVRGWLLSLPHSRLRSWLQSLLLRVAFAQTRPLRDVCAFSVIVLKRQGESARGDSIHPPRRQGLRKMTKRYVSTWRPPFNRSACTGILMLLNPSIKQLTQQLHDETWQRMHGVLAVNSPSCTSLVQGVPPLQTELLKYVAAKSKVRVGVVKDFPLGRSTGRRSDEGSPQRRKEHAQPSRKSTPFRSDLGRRAEPFSVFSPVGRRCR